MSTLARRFPALPAMMVAVLLSACSSIAERPHKACVDMPILTGTSRAAEIMRNYDTLSKQPATEIAQEYAKAVQDFSAARSDSNRLRVAMLLALPDTPFHDTAAALDLLNDWPQDETAPPSALRGFARLLSVMLIQQQQSNNALNEMTQKIKEEQKRADALQEKIDAVKNMEKNLVDRNKQ